MIGYTIDKNRIVKVVFRGKIDFLSITKWLANFSEIENFPSELKLIYDLRQANVEIDANNLMHIAEQTAEVTKKYKSVRTAFLLSETKLDTYKNLFSFLKNNKNTVRKAYSDFNNAYNWLLKDISPVTI